MPLASAEELMNQLCIQLQDPTQLSPPYTGDGHRCGCTRTRSLHQAPIHPEQSSEERLVLLLSQENGESKFLPLNPYLLQLLSKGQMVAGTRWELLQEAVVLLFSPTPSSPAGATG